MTLPRVGQYLYASCAGEDVGRIVAVGKDENDCPTIDFEVFDINELLHYEHDDSGKPEVFCNPLTRLELPPGTKLILRAVQWYSRPEWCDRPPHDDVIVCNTPVGGCFRCSRMFNLHDKPVAEWSAEPW